MELWEAAAGVIIGASSAFGAWRGAKKKDKGIEEQLKPLNGDVTLAAQIAGISGKVDLIHDRQERMQEGQIETIYMARRAREETSDVLAILKGLPCQTTNECATQAVAEKG